MSSTSPRSNLRRSLGGASCCAALVLLAGACGESARPDGSGAALERVGPPVALPDQPQSVPPSPTARANASVGPPEGQDGISADEAKRRGVFTGRFDARLLATGSATAGQRKALLQNAGQERDSYRISLEPVGAGEVHPADRHPRCRAEHRADRDRGLPGYGSRYERRSRHRGGRPDPALNGRCCRGGGSTLQHCRTTVRISSSEERLHDPRRGVRARTLTYGPAARSVQPGKAAWVFSITPIWSHHCRSPLVVEHPPWLPSGLVFLYSRCSSRWSELAGASRDFGSGSGPPLSLGVRNRNRCLIRFLEPVLEPW